MKRTRLKAEDRREVIVVTAMLLAADKNYTKVTREAIAEALGISPPAVQYHFGTMKQLHRATMRAACQRATTGDENALRVVAQGLSAGDSFATRVSDGVKAAAAGLLCK